MDIQIAYADMPAQIKAFSTLNTDGSYTIILNSRLSYEELEEALLHERQHIEDDDHRKPLSANFIEVSIRKEYIKEGYDL